MSLLFLTAGPLAGASQGDDFESLLAELQKTQGAIDACEAEIVEVKTTLKGGGLSAADLTYWRKEKEQLRKEKEQLRKKEELLLRAPKPEVQLKGPRVTPPLFLTNILTSLTIHPLLFIPMHVRSRPRPLGHLLAHVTLASPLRSPCLGSWFLLLPSRGASLKEASCFP